MVVTVGSRELCTGSRSRRKSHEERTRLLLRLGADLAIAPGFIHEAGMQLKGLYIHHMRTTVTTAGQRQELNLKLKQDTTNKSCFNVL